MNPGVVFISYAREDARHADRLYMDLRAAGIDAWLDTRCLMPGQNWKREITRVIRGAAYFLALISQHSINKRGFVQSEVKRALQVMTEVPNDQIFLIPVRLDECHPADEELQDINWVDLFPNYEKGLTRILKVCSGLSKTPLEYQHSGEKSSGRAPIHYTPYRSFADFARDLVERLPRSGSLADPDYAIYVRYRTTIPSVKLPSELLEKYPEEITIVLQHRFEALTASRDSFSVVLWFSGKPETLVIPYIAVREIALPSIGLRIENFGLAPSPETPVI